MADVDEDNDGYNTTDQGDGVVDAFPTDGSQWNDTDGDGYGDNPDPATTPDACIGLFGTSTQDRYGCPDNDGDGWSDDGDWAPNDPEQWKDTDGDGYGDEYYFEVVNTFFHINQRGDAFPSNQLNGMIQIVMDGVIIMLTSLGTSLEIQHGQARLLMVPPKLISFL